MLLFQGEEVCLRLPCGSLKPVNIALGSLFFHDGSQKTLAGFVSWISILLVSELETDAMKFEDPMLLNLVSSLLRIKSVVRATPSQDELDMTISRIVRQNADSKVQPVSSLTWASILATFGDARADQAIARYNCRPEVKAYEGSGTGSISIDGRKKQAGSW